MCYLSAIFENQHIIGRFHQKSLCIYDMRNIDQFYGLYMVIQLYIYFFRISNSSKLLC